MRLMGDCNFLPRMSIYILRFLWWRRRIYIFQDYSGWWRTCDLLMLLAFLWNGIQAKRMSERQWNCELFISVCYNSV